MSNDRAMPHIGGMLSPAAILMHGNVYAVVEDDVEYASALIGATLLDACAGADPVCLVTAPRRVESVLGRGALARAVEAGRVAILQRAPAPEAAGLSGRLIEEIEHFGQSGHALVILDEAGVLLGAAREPALLLRQWRAWAERHDNIVLMVFRHRAGEPREPVAALLPAMHMLAGLARVRNAYESSVWEVFHWFHPGGASAGKSLLLERAHDGRLALREHPALRALPMPAADDDAVFATRDVLLPVEQPLPGWQMVDRLDELPARMARAQAATVLLGLNHVDAYESVARCVFALRKACGARLKIVVREVNGRMRQSQEALAIRLGANLVIPAGVNHSRFVGMVAMVQGQVFQHVLPASYEAAVADVMPERERGYLAPADFIRAVTAALGRGQAQRVPSALVELPLAYGLAPLDALRYCQIKRDGDLCTADRDSVYLFLCACREGDVGLTLERLFRLPVGDLFGGERRYLVLPDIRDAIGAIGAGAAPALPDLTAALAAIERDEHGAPAPMLAMADMRNNGPASDQYSAPAPAIRRALPLRAAA